MLILCYPDCYLADLSRIFQNSYAYNIRKNTFKTGNISKNMSNFSRFVVDIKNFVGRHTGQHVASLLDTMVDSIPGLKDDADRVAVTDSGSNMLLGMKLAKSVTDNLRCLDHILNTAISEAWKKERKTPVSKVIAKATALATRTHKSSLSAGHIRQVCSEMPEDNKVKYRKIITPCETRWNSQFMCLQSIFQLKNALLRLKFEPRDAELVPLIPDEAEFDVIASLLPPLQELKNISETLSSDTKPTLHMVVPLLFNVANLDKMFPLSGSVVIDFLKKVCRIFLYFSVHNFFFQHVPVFFRS
jgi:hypothetical protein